MTSDEEQKRERMRKYWVTSDEWQKEKKDKRGEGNEWQGLSDEWPKKKAEEKCGKSEWRVTSDEWVKEAWKGTRSDTQQDSRGRLGRSSNVRTARNSKMWRTDRHIDLPTNTARCRVACPRLKSSSLFVKQIQTFLSRRFFFNSYRGNTILRRGGSKSLSHPPTGRLI